MYIEPSIGMIVILFGIGGFVTFCFYLIKYINKKIKNKEGVFNYTPNDELIDCSFSTDFGTGKINGDKQEFQVYFDGGQVGFLVKDGVITEYKAKNNSNYQEYPIGKGGGK